MDDTIENLCEAWCAELNKRHGTRVSPLDIKEWDLQKAFPGLQPSDIYAPLFDEGFWDTVKPIPGAQKALGRLIEDGHRVLIVTASHPETVPMKLNKVLFRYFPFIDYHNVIVASQKDVVHGDVRIDDNPENLLCGKDDSFKILFSQPHNISFKCTINGITRAENWDDIYALITLYAY